MSKNTVVILRGISGAGKSTYIREHFPNAVICSADHHFEGEDGSYNFDPRGLSTAHGKCKNKFMQALEDKEPVIVVDNTNTQLKEFRPYVVSAKHAGYRVKIVRLVVDPKIAAKRNAHGVPEEVIKRMQARMVDTPPEWGEEIVDTTPKKTW